MTVYKPGYGPLPGTSSTGNTTGMPKVSKPSKRKADSKNIIKTNTPPNSNTNKPGSHDPGFVEVPGGRVNPKIKPKTRAGKAAGAAAGGVTDTAPPVTPTVPTGNPEDVALADVSVPNSPGYGAVGNGGTNLAGQFDPTTYGKTMAGMQYDPQITQMASRIKGIINALPGSLESLHKAFANLSAKAAAPVTQAPLGGNTGATSETYAAATAGNANDAAAAQARAAAGREADWATRIRLMSDANVGDLRGQLQGLTAGKADATTAYTQQGIKTKSDLVSQAIANINSIRASNAAQAMVQGQLEQQGAKTTGMLLQNANAALINQYAPLQYEQGLVQGNQTITANAMDIDQAKETLKKNNPQKNLATALSTGGPQAALALQAMVIPPGGITQNEAGYSHVMGDPNTWTKNGIAQIMRQLPKSSRANVTKFVHDLVSQAISPAGGWTQNKNGKWVRPK